MTKVLKSLGKLLGLFTRTLSSPGRFDFPEQEWVGMTAYLEAVSETTSYLTSTQKVHVLNVDLTWSFHHCQAEAEGFEQKEWVPRTRG